MSVLSIKIETIARDSFDAERKLTVATGLVGPMVTELIRCCLKDARVQALDQKSELMAITKITAEVNGMWKVSDFPELLK